MVKIANKQIDLVLQLEEYSSRDNIFKLLSLDVQEILIICPELTLQRFIQYAHDNISQDNLELLESDLMGNKQFTFINITYKGKGFIFHFIILRTKTKIISHPIHGQEEYRVAFNIINI